MINSKSDILHRLRPALLLLMALAFLGASLPCECCKEVTSESAKKGDCHSHQKKSDNHQSSKTDKSNCCCSSIGVTNCKLSAFPNISSNLSLEKSPLFITQLPHQIFYISEIPLSSHLVRGSPELPFTIIRRSSTLPIYYRRLVV
jgi:hypothetical protein